MCCPGRNITDPPSALCIKRLESGYCCFIQSNEDKRRTERWGGERRGHFQNHLLCCHLFKIQNCFPVLKGVFKAFTQPVNLLIFTRQRSFSVHEQLFCPGLWDFQGFKASLVFIFLKFLVFSVLFAPFRTLCTSMAGPQPYFCKPKDQRKKQVE